MEAKEKIKKIVDFVMDLDMLTGVDTDEREHIETAVIEGYKEGIKEVVEWAIKERQNLQKKKTEQKIRKPDDVANQIILGAKAKAFQQVIDKWGSHE